MTYRMFKQATLGGKIASSIAYGEDSGNYAGIEADGAIYEKQSIADVIRGSEARRAQTAAEKPQGFFARLLKGIKLPAIEAAMKTIGG